MVQKSRQKVKKSMEPTKKVQKSKENRRLRAAWGSAAADEVEPDQEPGPADEPADEPWSPQAEALREAGFDPAAPPQAGSDDEVD